SPSPAPTPTPTPTPNPAYPNLIINPQFSEVTSGWASNWTRDNTESVGIISEQGNSKLRFANTTNSAVHTFSQKIVLPSTNASYIWKQQVESQHTSGEFGFYIDEYNAQGEWISGQWLGLTPYGFTGE